MLRISADSVSRWVEEMLEKRTLETENRRRVLAMSGWDGVHVARRLRPGCVFASVLPTAVYVGAGSALRAAFGSRASEQQHSGPQPCADNVKIKNQKSKMRARAYPQGVA